MGVVRLGEGKEADMVGKGCEGDWEYKTPKAPVPVKLTVKKMNAQDWMVACMVKETEGILKQEKFNITGKDPPLEIMEVECEMADFFEAGITDMIREGETLKVIAGEKNIVFALDKQ